MAVLVACFAFPATLLALSGGIGLLIDRLAGRTLPGPLVLPVGFAGVVVLSQLLTRRDGLSDLTPYALVAVGVLGLILGRRRLTGLRSALEPALAFVAVYAVGVAPVLLLGRVSIVGYLRDTTPGTHLAGAHDLIDHGASFAWAPDTSDGHQLRGYFDMAYPSGGHTALGGVGRLFSTDLMWLFQPFLAVCLAVGAPALWLLARRLGLSRLLALLAAVVASVPAITYAYALQGSLKEITLLPTLAAVPALLAARDAWLPAGPRGVLPLAVLGAAAVYAIGIAAGAWVVLAFAIAALAFMLDRGVSRRSWRRFVLPVAALVGTFALLIGPVLLNLALSLRVANNFSQSNPSAAADPGNLVGPLRAIQAFGVWINGDQRTPPPPNEAAETYALIGVMVLAFAVGVVELWRRGARSTLGWLAGSCLIWWALTRKGTIWTDAKLLVLVAPTLVFVAFVGASGLRRAGRWVAIAVGATLAFGVLRSDAELYHVTNPMPTERYAEALQLDRRFAGQGPAFNPDFDEYLLAALRRTHIVGLGYAFDPAWSRTTDGSVVPYGHSVDLDGVELATLEGTPLIIRRTTPEGSRPPSNFRLVYHGPSWEVWHRVGPAPLAHLGVNGAGDPTAVPRCADLRALAATARRERTQLVVAERPRLVVRDLGKAAMSANWVPAPDEGAALYGPGRLNTTLRLPNAGRWRIWLRGDLTRPVAIEVDGHTVGRVGYQSGGIGSYILPVIARLNAGRHDFALVRGGGSLHPGDGNPTAVRRMVLEPAGARTTMRTVAPERWRDLCGRRVDWVEAAAPGAGTTPAPRPSA